MCKLPFCSWSDHIESLDGRNKPKILSFVDSACMRGLFGEHGGFFMLGEVHGDIGAVAAISAIRTRGAIRGGDNARVGHNEAIRE